MRVNLIDPFYLTDEHLIAEANEINMISGTFLRSLNSKGGIKYDKIPKEYLLGEGHVYFFYNKARYLSDRYEALKTEARKRGINIVLPWKNVFDESAIIKAGFNLWENYEPTFKALELITDRICERVMEKPNFYSYTLDNGRVFKIDAEKYCESLKLTLAASTFRAGYYYISF